MTGLVVSLADDEATVLSAVGGKGANLARLTAADLPVPPGWCVTTATYRTLVETPAIQTAIDSLDELPPGDTDAIAELSATIRSHIKRQSLPTAVRRALTASLDFEQQSYAVRSSATAEDLPTASFAGQHETYLGVSGRDAVFGRVRDCLASLFTERAVTYRLRNEIPNADVAMAVVVQEMVDADAAGVLFTADPVSGNRTVASVDGNFGLGDTVVAGDVSPDNARIDRRTNEILAYEVGEKRHALRPKRARRGGTELVTMSSERQQSRVLSAVQLRELVALGGRVEWLLGDPQDIEWALVDDEFVLLQSRPITSLYPLPSPRPMDDRLHVYLSFGHVQAMPEAMPPLVSDVWQGFMNEGIAALKGEDGSGHWATEAGGRLYIDLTPLLRIAPIRRVLPSRVAAVSEPAADGLRDLLARRRDSFPDRGHLGEARTVARAVRRGWGIFRILLQLVGRSVQRFALGPSNPREEQAWVEAWGIEVATRIRGPETLVERVQAVFDAVDFSLVVSGPLSRIGSPLLASIAAQKALTRLFPDAETDIDAIGKGFESELVTRMNQQLGDLADIVRDSPAVRDALRNGASLEALEAVTGGRTFVHAFDEFLTEFGHRASGEIDLSRPRWRDDPAALLQTIRSNLGVAESGSHRRHLDRLQREASEATARLESRANRGVFGPAKVVLVRRLIETYRGGIQLREYPKQGAAHLFTAIHEVLSEAGTSLADEGQLERASDVWFLRKDELLAALGDGTAITADIEARRRTHARNATMTPPPLLTSEGEAPTATRPTDSSGTVLTGTPVSAGVVEGLARVVRDPSGEGLVSGEILVAPSTDPGWTPLFLNAAGLVMDVGGRMTHGALVAREYGIPAVAAVSEATSTIQTGERIRIDGKRGTVELLDRERPRFTQK